LSKNKIWGFAISTACAISEEAYADFAATKGKFFSLLANYFKTAFLSPQFKPEGHAEDNALLPFVNDQGSWCHC
jgi:hypothetical protein